MFAFWLCVPLCFGIRHISSVNEGSVICGPIRCTVDFRCRLIHLKIIFWNKPLEVLFLFPVACCEYSSLLLARFLIEIKDYNPKDISMIKGQSILDVDQLHLWRKVNGVIVDITAGQFNEAEKPIIIDEYSSWHNKYFYVLDTYNTFNRL